MRLPDELHEIANMTAEERAAWAKQRFEESAAAGEAYASRPQRDVDAGYLEECGFGRRYRYPNAEKVGEGYQEALATYCADLPAALRAGTGLLLLGKPGVGKTHVLALLALAFRDIPREHEMQRQVRVAYVFAPDLFNALHHNDGEKLHEWERAQVLLLDDVCRLYSTDWNTSRFDAFAEGRYSAMKVTCATMNSADVLQNAQLQRLADRWRETMLPVTTQAQSQREAQAGGRRP